MEASPSLVKLMVIGDSSVGKSCLLLRYTSDSFSDEYVSTTGVDFKLRSVSIQGEPVKLQMWSVVPANFTHGVSLVPAKIIFSQHEAQLKQNVPFIWLECSRDTSGQSRFRTITSSFYKGCHGVVIVYDVTNSKSFHHVSDIWLGQLEK